MALHTVSQTCDAPSAAIHAHGAPRALTSYHPAWYARLQGRLGQAPTVGVPPTPLRSVTTVWSLSVTAW
jgi:hypothetical protein